ncbi:MAG: hypothetical protein AAGD04_10535 [Pseudomonadota bacterium]
MLPANFTIAMRNSLSIGPFDRPSELTGFALEWLIVERFGPFIAISDASSLLPEEAKDIAHPAPDRIARNNTLVATLIELDPMTGNEYYLFSQFPIQTSLTLGNFFPGEGYVRLCAQDGKVTLQAHGRHAHSKAPDGSNVNAGQPGDNIQAINWHFDAVQRPWSGEIFNTEV